MLARRWRHDARTCLYDAREWDGIANSRARRGDDSGAHEAAEEAGKARARAWVLATAADDLDAADERARRRAG